MNGNTATSKTHWALLCALACSNATAADLSPDQVRSTLSRATASTPADFSGKDLSDLDLPRASRGLGGGGGGWCCCFHAAEPTRNGIAVQYGKAAWERRFAGAVRLRTCVIGSGFPSSS